MDLHWRDRAPVRCVGTALAPQETVISVIFRRTGWATAAAAAVLVLSFPAVARAADPAPAPGVTAITAFEAYDTNLKARPQPLASGAFWGQIDIKADLAPDAGFTVSPLSQATLTVTDSAGKVTSYSGTADDYQGSYAWFHLDSRTLADGPLSLHVAVAESATDPAAPEQSRTLQGDSSAVNTANPHVLPVSPAAQAVVWGPTTYTFDAQPSAAGTPIDHVEFSYEGVQAVAATDSTAPYTFTTNYSGLAGDRGVTAVAVDRDGYRSAPVTLGVVASPGPAVTVDLGNKVLDAEGEDQLFANWTATLPDGWNTPSWGPQYYRQWLTEVSLAVDGRTVVDHKESDGCYTPLGLANCQYHNVSVSWGDELPQTGLGVGVHQVSVTATDSTGASHTTTTQFTIAPDKLELFVQQVPASGVVQGQRVSAAVQMRSGTNEAVAPRAVALQAQYAGSSAWHTVATTRTLANGDGTWFSFTPQENAVYRAVTTDAGAHLVSTTTFNVKVKPRLSVKSSATRVTRGGTVRFTATASSREKGASVLLQVYRSGRWSTVATARQSAAGTAVFAVREGSRGSFAYRVVTQSSARFAGSVSAQAHLTVV